jgi:hypothetical protein
MRDVFLRIDVYAIRPHSYPSREFKMNTGARTILITLLYTLVVGCGAKEAEPEGVIPQGYKDAVNKAENVEGLLQSSQENRSKDIE